MENTKTLWNNIPIDFQTNNLFNIDDLVLCLDWLYNTPNNKAKLSNSIVGLKEQKINIRSYKCSKGRY